MVVVLGGAGSLIGTVVSALGIAQFQSIMEFFLSGVLAKVLILVGVIVVLIIKPSGLFVSRVRK
jgi:urea transport system permease protein